MRFEWDAAKNTTNAEKRGVDFVFAARVFEGRLLTAVDRRRDYGEPRFMSLGETDGIVLVIVWTPRGAETIRLISARRASGKETERYRA